MAPIATALRDAGHQVAFATGARFHPTIERAGFTTFSCGLDYDAATNALTKLPEWADICTRESQPALRQVMGFVEGLSYHMAVDVLPVVESWRPGLIVREPVEYGGYIAAERHGLPCASVMWGTYIDARFFCPGSIHALRARFDLRADPELDSVDRDLVMKFLPLWWELPGINTPPSTRCFCAPPWDHAGDGVLPCWVDDLPDRPTVYATLGTTFNKAPETFRALFDALGGEPFNVIVTVGRTMDPSAFGAIPANVHVEQYVPQSLILPHCDAMIFHGGYNSLLSGLWHGLPLVIIPLEGGDQWPTARMCAAQGAGIHVDGNPPEVANVRAAVRTVLQEPRFRARSQAVGAEIRALPPLSEAVRLLEDLVKQDMLRIREGSSRNRA